MILAHFCQKFHFNTLLNPSKALIFRNKLATSFSLPKYSMFSEPQSHLLLAFLLFGTSSFSVSLTYAESRPCYGCLSYLFQYFHSYLSDFNYYIYYFSIFLYCFYLIVVFFCFVWYYLVIYYIRNVRGYFYDDQTRYCYWCLCRKSLSA